MRTSDLHASKPRFDAALHDTLQVLDMLDVEQLAPLQFRGRADSERRRLFGGLLVGQGLIAASRTTARRPHSLHAIFIDGGKQMPVDYTVDALRDGGKFSSRRVTAHQDGRTIFEMLVSFQDDEPGLSHQEPAPFIDDDTAELTAWGPRWKQAAKQDETFYRAPVEFFTSGWDPYENCQPSVARNIWIRSPVDFDFDNGMHEALFAYASDYCLLFSALQPHGIGRSDARLQRASLDHTIWFHQRLRIDDWLLLAMTSPSASGGRGLSQSAVYDLAGNRVATVMQEALIRIR
ncbi:MAG TPA: acyl-CoA thioesterase domain-containing protein [Paraburkholderia sp.]|jgi:acyl-CoA thioesterase-2